MTDEHLSLEARFQECEVPSSCMEERHILELKIHSAEWLKRQVRHASSAMFQVYT